jgi:glutathione S-transferase
LTIADFQLASMATDWREAAMPFSDFPNILRWLDGLAHIPAWANPWPGARVSN